MSPNESFLKKLNPNMVNFRLDKVKTPPPAPDGYCGHLISPYAKVIKSADLKSEVETKLSNLTSKDNWKTMEKIKAKTPIQRSRFRSDNNNKIKKKFFQISNQFFVPKSEKFRNANSNSWSLEVALFAIRFSRFSCEKSEICYHSKSNDSA